MPRSYQIIKGIASKIGVKGLYYTERVDNDDFFISPDFNYNQFFFDKSTARYLVDLLIEYDKICCLCTPRLAYEWFERGKIVTLLDIDKRFSYIPGYQYYDLKNPAKLNKEYELIIIDPPFSLGAQEIRKAVDAITSESSLQLKLFIFFPLDREKELITAFSEWNLQRIILRNLKWNNIRGSYNNQYGVYSNRYFKLR